MASCSTIIRISFSESMQRQSIFIERNFRYPTRRDYKVLRNFDLTVHSGHTVALVGSSGCGKTTIFSLIARLYDVNVGNVVGNLLFFSQMQK